MLNGKDLVKIPIRSLDEYKIRYNHNKSKDVGQGEGESNIGYIVTRESSAKGKTGPGKGKKAGDQPGIDYYEAEVSLEEIEEVLFKELELPRLKQRERAEVKTEKIEFNEVRKKGLMGKNKKKRTI